MITVSNTYELVYQLKGYEFIKVTRDGVIINTKNNTIRKFKLNGRSLGIWVSSKKFMPKSKLNSYLELIPKENKLIFDPLFGSHKN